MYRIILFLLLIAIAAAGAAWVADQPGDVVLSWGQWQAAMKLPVFVLGFGIAIVAAMMPWAVVRGLWRLPRHLTHKNRAKKHARGRHAVTQGLLAIGHGDATAARSHAAVARKHAAEDPLTLLLHAQSAQLDGDRERARLAFRAMAEREDTRLLGLRGLFIEAQRGNDPHHALLIAEQALKLSPGSTWAAHAVLGHRCAMGDWSGAITILNTNLASGLIDKPTYKRQRGVLLTARAIELEHADRDLSRESVMEAVKLAPTLVPAAVLAAKFESEAHQTRRAMRIVETAWLAQPHPDLAEAYAHVRLGDSARQRLARIEALAAKSPATIESGLAVARASIDASDFAKARAALEPYIESPTQRVAMLMAEIERTEHGDSGRARAWTLRAIRARHDPVWTADGYVSDRWRPVSPVSGRLDAFQWQTPLAALPSEISAAIEAKEFQQAYNEDLKLPRQLEAAREPPAAQAQPALAPPAQQDNAPALPAAGIEPPQSPAADTQPSPSPAPAEAPMAAGAPLPRARPDLSKDRLKAAVPPVIPLVRAPDDPGIDDEPSPRGGFDGEPRSGQAGGWRGFLTRWGN